MPKKDDDGSYIISETGNWNVADLYSKSKIMRYLSLSDVYQEQATFGFNDFNEDGEQQMYDDKDLNRIRGFERFVYVLMNLIENTLFAVKRDKAELITLLKELKKVNEIKHLLYKKTTNQVNSTQQIRIDEKKYQKVLARVIEIKTEINEPLNKNHLIYTDKEEFDPKAYKESIKERMIKHG